MLVEEKDISTIHSGFADLFRIPSDWSGLWTIWPKDFPARVINTSKRHSLLNKFYFIELCVCSAPPRPFICLLALLSCGPVISGTCLWTTTLFERTWAVESPAGESGENQMLCQNLWSAKIIWLCLSFSDFVKLSAWDWLRVWSVPL